MEVSVFTVAASGIRCAKESGVTKKAPFVRLFLCVALACGCASSPGTVLTDEGSPESGEGSDAVLANEELTSSIAAKVLFPHASEVVKGDVFFDASATAPGGVRKVEMLVDGNVVGKTTPTIYGYVFSWNSTTVADGAHKIAARATDNAGATRTSASITVYVLNHPRRRSESMGMTMYIDAKGDGKELDAIKALGVKWVRVSQEWQWLSSAPGKIDYTNYERIVWMAKARGLKVLALAMGAPAWANGGHQDSGHYPPTASHIPDFAAYAAGLAVRGADAIEIWNEPNNPSSFFLPKPNVNTWAQIMIASYAAIKRANATIPVVTGGMAPYGDLNNTSDPNVATLAPVNFFKNAMNVPGFKDSFDGVGHHPYIYPDDPITAKIGWNALMQTRLLHDTLVAAKVGDRPFWFTEYGNCTAPAVSRCLNETASAFHYQRYLDGMVMLEREGIQLGPAFSFTMRDTDGVSREGSMGIFRTNGTEKPSVSILRNAAASWW